MVSISELASPVDKCLVVALLCMVAFDRPADTCFPTLSLHDRTVPAYLPWSTGGEDDGRAGGGTDRQGVPHQGAQGIDDRG